MEKQEISIARQGIAEDSGQAARYKDRNLERFRLHLLAGLPGKGRLFFLYLRVFGIANRDQVTLTTLSLYFVNILIKGGILLFAYFKLMGWLVSSNEENTGYVGVVATDI